MLAKRTIAALSIVVCVSIVAYGQGNTFKKIRYQGGSVATTVKPDDWDNTLIVTPDKITLKFKDGKVQDVDPKRVTGLSYGQEAHRRVGALDVSWTPNETFCRSLASEKPKTSARHFAQNPVKEQLDSLATLLLYGVVDRSSLQLPPDDLFSFASFDTTAPIQSIPPTFLCEVRPPECCGYSSVGDPHDALQ